jgi:hypothetical protein
MDCPICHETIRCATICSCVHHFCYDCITSWCKLKNTCPVCKECIFELRRDPEFDQLNNNNHEDLAKLNELVIEMPDGTNPGVSLKNNSPGVKIIRLNKKDQFYKYGVPLNSIILFINNIPCVNHKQSIDIIDSLTLSNKNIKLKFLIK